MKKLHVPARPALALGALALFTLTACTQQQEDVAVSTPTTSAASTTTSATPSPSTSAAASASTPSATPSATPSPSASVVIVIPSAEPTQTPVVQEEVPVVEQPTVEATTAPAEPEPTPTVSVITVPAPGNNPSATATATSSALANQATVCGYSNIHIAAATTEGAAGSRYISLTFTNTGTSPCMISGWPTVNYVDAAGNAIGASATQAAEWTSSGELLQPGGSATATLRETRAGLYGDTCQAVTAAGYQVGIPGTENSLVLNFPAEACSNKSIAQLSVGQVGANS